jgi:Uma2 family endonuclease
MELSIDLGMRYSYADFLTWIDGIRRELHDGYVKLMGSPRSRHQRVGRRLVVRTSLLMERIDGCCELFYDMDVCFPEGDELSADRIRTVVCPDVIVVCDASKVSEYCCVGAPDLVIEILSPSTSHRDQHYKYELYERHGVREYWVVDPVGEWIRVFTLGVDGRYGDGVLYERGSSVPVGIFGGALIEFSAIFKQ